MDGIKSRCDILCTDYKEAVKNGKLPVQVTVHQRKGVESSSWLGSISFYSGAFVVLLHSILHHSVRPIAQLTIGVCFVVEIFFLIKFLNKLLQFEFVLNVSKLFLRNFLLATVVFLSVVLGYVTLSKTLTNLFAGVTHDELLAIFSPSVYFCTVLLNYVYNNRIMHSISCLSLTLMFGAYW
uniref:Uncharacterized protein LOC100183505 n=1 Tax=Phallusia mammillata TaxID=59560 RepID=A0A6F9DIL8_9ASCI|nr:uncharacterized protein LOC100183505 [Phallusia mammillata]